MRLALLLMPIAVMAEERCAPCHASLVAGYARTGMGRSMTKPKAESQTGRQWWHDISARRFGVEWREGKLLQFVEGLKMRSVYEPAWAIGSGNEGKSYVHQVGDSLFQTPISWYAARLFWDMSPGYHLDDRADFYRPITMECLTCHAGRVSPVAGSHNRYASIDEPSIGCARCHGDASEHLRDGRRGNIVNPAKLERAKRDSVCESCHLSGEARIPNPGRSFDAFKPGMQLEEVFSVYVSKKNSADTVLKVVSHSEQLASSRCATESNGKLWCASCHDPHSQPPEKERVAFYRDRCLQCHSVQDHRANAGDDCAKCHMPRTRAYDGGHAAFTDHWIRLRSREARFIDRGELLRAWREPPANLATRNLAMAYIAQRNSLKRYREGIRLLNEAIREGHRDPAFGGVVGLQFLKEKKFEAAVAWFSDAATQEPNSSLARLNLAAALLSAGKRDDAKREAEEA
ncbi:MAG: tetratricopeptide repeat protein, partial [Acidobacteria bacterium]|nr:tetratricopeptide repeat protein [Acidobacteriota bacterium]